MRSAILPEFHGGVAQSPGIAEGVVFLVGLLFGLTVSNL
jgi:hypothetical protein